MSRPWRAVVAVLVGAGLTLAACGDDGNDGPRVARQVADGTAVRTEAPTSAPASPATATEQTSTAPVVEPTGVVVSVAALDNTFRPERVEVAVGDEVLWENRGQNDHDVLYVDGDDWGVEVENFGPGAAYAHVFTAPGEYRYYCSIHGTDTIGMTGTIIVSG